MADCPFCKKGPTPRAIKRVVGLLSRHGHHKHGDGWKRRDDRIDMSHADVHRVHYFDEDWLDHDSETGELHLVHAIARELLVLERRLLRDGD